MQAKKNWKIAKKIPRKLCDKLEDINPFILQILLNRGIFSQRDSIKRLRDKIQNFLNPSYENLYDPFLFKDMKKAIKRIERAIKNKEKIAIFGDYDADGVTSSAVLYETLSFLGTKPDVYIPHREKEGYGLNDDAITHLVKKGVNLIITVDCGIRNDGEIRRAKKLGIDVIVTDHHEPGDDMPKRAIALLDPKIKGSGYPFMLLAGVGVAYKLAQAMIITFAKDRKEGENFLKWLLDLVAIGSLGDIVPLIDENRTLVKYGGLVFIKTRREGLLVMKGERNNHNLRFIDFFVAPRINAAGRMDHANWAFKLLTSESKIEAFKLFKRIEGLNNDRRTLTEEIVKEAKSEVEPVLPEEKLLFLANTNWSAAVSGIVANRLVDEYNVPVFVAQAGKEFSKGSARSPKGVGLIELLSPLSHLFEKLGGHKYAAGFTYKTKDHDLIVKSLTDAARNLKPKKADKGIDIDAQLDISDLTTALYKDIEKLAPFGEGNPEPLFILKDCTTRAKRKVGNNHLKLWIEKNRKKVEVIAFGKGHWDEELAIGEKIDIIFKLGENEYRGIKSLQLEAVDMERV